MTIVPKLAGDRPTESTMAQGPRDRDRRATITRAVADLLTCVGPAPTASSLVGHLEPLLRQFAPITALRVDHRSAPGRGVVVDFSSVTVSIPHPPEMSPLALTVVFEHGYRPDDWTQQWLETVACLVGVCLRLADGESGRVGPRTAASHGPQSAAGRLLGQSPAMSVVRDRVRRYAAADEPVLILGESGTGKELIAHAIHEQSPRRHGAFVDVNCASLVATLLEAELFGIEDGTATGVRGRQGKFELARGGTLFLDEVADLSPQGQASLLRVLQERRLERVGGHRTIEVDVRIVAATNRLITPPLAGQAFRPDLYYRLRVLPLQVPPLRDRDTDAVELAGAFLGRDSRGWRWDLRPDAVDALLDCEWPGNVRDVQSVVHLIRALAPSPVVDRPLVQTALTELGLTSGSDVTGRPLTVKEAAAHHALKVLLACGGNKTRACEQLGITAKTLRIFLRLLNEASPAESRRKAA